jgi:hypothetical protein
VPSVVGDNRGCLRAPAPGRGASQSCRTWTPPPWCVGTSRVVALGGWLPVGRATDPPRHPFRSIFPEWCLTFFFFLSNDDSPIVTSMNALTWCVSHTTSTIINVPDLTYPFLPLRVLTRSGS